MRDVRIILADPDGCTLGKTIPVSGTVPKDISIFTVQREDQDEDIINNVALPLVGDSYCCCTAVSSSGINTNTSGSDTCPRVQTTAGMQETLEQTVIGRGMRARCGDESVHSPALLYMLSLALCAPRKRTAGCSGNEHGVHIVCLPMKILQHYGY